MDRVNNDHDIFSSQKHHCVMVNENVSLIYCSFIIGDDCTAMIWVYPFFSLGGWYILEKRWDRKKEIIYKGKG